MKDIYDEYPDVAKEMEALVGPYFGSNFDVLDVFLKGVGLSALYMAIGSLLGNAWIGISLILAFTGVLLVKFRRIEQKYLSE